MNALPHDGWKSRKVIIGLSTFMLVFGFIVGAYFFGKTAVSFGEAADLLKWLVPSVLVPTMGALSYDKRAQALATSGK